jgi:hypothetical protein
VEVVLVDYFPQELQVVDCHSHLVQQAVLLVVLQEVQQVDSYLITPLKNRLCL